LPKNDGKGKAFTRRLKMAKKKDGKTRKKDKTAENQTILAKKAKMSRK